MATGLNGFLISPSAGQMADFIGRAAVALSLGALIGVERQWRQRMAGLRTNALVALGAALFELFSVLLGGSAGQDPTRIAAYVVSGIGFLGAGVILRDGVNIRGINTAATIWCSAAVGVLAGAGYVFEAIVGAVFVVSVHALLRPLAQRIDRLPTTEESEVETVYKFDAVCRSDDEAHIRALVVQALTRDEFVLRAVRSEDLDRGTDLVKVEAELQRFGRDDVALEGAVSRLSLEPSVSSVSWYVVGDGAVVLAVSDE
jgi:putative Mg2+ transporter-C (MgtC) family protein